MVNFECIPNNTFLNLPPDKQNLIVQVAIEEFAGNGYQQASLNTIVKRLGIAKGSLYQYFENKEALFLYVFDRFTGSVKKMVKESVGATTAEDDFFEHVRQVLWAGVQFIDKQPEYFQIYLKVLFEQDVPYREELLARVRLFSREYFAPVCHEDQRRGKIRKDIPLSTIVFMLDATMDRFLQGYARPYLDGGLGLARKSRQELDREIHMIIAVLRDGLLPREKGE